MSKKSKDKNKVVSSEIASMQSSNNKLDNTVYTLSSNNKLNNTVYTLSEALSSVDEAVTRDAMIKVYDVIERKKNLISSFNENNYCVKSYSCPNHFSHNINIDEGDWLNVTLIALDTMLMYFAAMR